MDYRPVKNIFLVFALCELWQAPADPLHYCRSRQYVSIYLHIYSFIVYLHALYLYLKSFSLCFIQKVLVFLFFLTLQYLDILTLFLLLWVKSSSSEFVRFLPEEDLLPCSFQTYCNHLLIPSLSIGQKATDTVRRKHSFICCCEHSLPSADKHKGIGFPTTNMCDVHTSQLHSLKCSVSIFITVVIELFYVLKMYWFQMTREENN